jgi:hypothetical protein
MSKRQNRKDLLTLAEWAEDMSRHHTFLAADGDGVGRCKQQVRSHRFKAKRLGQIATVLRQQLGKRD